ncbi:MAG TPA: AtpZ/AtpI family protein [Chloroflexota bacterium]|nr:AtpZ/AtpI family protein [Chloroflexota bacterium]HUM68532.1 AtpZ/AtpI family protein [Chloroflexota bacterium]
MSKNQQDINTQALLASVVGQVGCLIVFIVFIALGAGLALDKFLGTKALFTVFLMVGSVPVALYFTVRLSLTAVNRAQIKMQQSEQTEEDTTT